MSELRPDGGLPTRGAGSSAIVALSAALTCDCNPNAEITFNTVASSGFPEDDGDFYRLSLPGPASRAIWLIPLALAISPKAAATS